MSRPKAVFHRRRGRVARGGSSVAFRASRSRPRRRPPLSPITLEGDAARGAVLAETCAGCHGVPGSHNAYPSYHVPKLGGQNADYSRSRCRATDAARAAIRRCRRRRRRLAIKTSRTSRPIFAGRAGEPEAGRSRGAGARRWRKAGARRRVHAVPRARAASPRPRSGRISRASTSRTCSGAQAVQGRRALRPR